MVKKLIYECQNCGHTEAKWAGKCPSCQEWNSLLEIEVKDEKSKKPVHRSHSGSSQSPKSRVQSLSAIEIKNESRISTGISEFNRVLGGGFLAGSSVLVGGEPGIGKSTLLLQAASALQEAYTVLYISGEESAGQIKSRSVRLGLKGDNLHLLCTGDLSEILKTLEKNKPQVLIVDSIQTIYNDDLMAAPGSPNQIKSAVYEISQWIKERSCAVFFIAHVTKEGSIAGPKTVEHMVDTVMYFEHSGTDLRYLRAAKNRFGSIDELGMFTMDAKGLHSLTNPEDVFYQQRDSNQPAGVVAAPIYEGSRVLMVEIQCLTVPAKGGLSRVYSDKVDQRRVSRIAAVLEKHSAFSFSDQDIYVNIAGGIQIKEVGIELALAICLFSARLGKAIPTHISFSGEISLSGEIKSVGHTSRRIQRAKELGFSQFYCSETKNTSKDTNNLGLELKFVSQISELLKELFPEAL
jgi:DNA repair protein RadA/Sms